MYPTTAAPYGIPGMMQRDATMSLAGRLGQNVSMRGRQRTPMTRMMLPGMSAMGAYAPNQTMGTNQASMFNRLAFRLGAGRF